MQVVDSQNFIKINQKIRKLIELDIYVDITINSDTFLERHGYYGWSFQNYYQVRFEKDDNYLKEIQRFLSNSENVYLYPISQTMDLIYEIQVVDFEEIITKNPYQDYLIVDKKLHWVLVMDKYRKLTGLGNYIVKL